MIKLALAHVESHLMLDGKKYEITDFNVAFSQPTDHKGQPQHETTGGRIHITLPHFADMYYKNQVVKRRVGFSPIGSDPDFTYRHEIDTALLALPVRIFQEQYLQTKDIYCLDGLSVLYKQD